MNKSIILLVSLLILWGGWQANVRAQSGNELLAELVAENEDAINALVLYPEDVREAILEATLHPEALVRLESIQSSTAASFRELVETYPRETQEMIWDLTRYPDLIHRLVKDGKPSSQQIDLVLDDYPDVIHERARTAAFDYYYQLVTVDELNRKASDAFEELLSGYPLSTSRALRQLLELPEVLSILTDNIKLTVLVGDLYRKDPAWVKYKADSLNLEVARQQAQEMEDWEDSLKENPEALEELKASTEAFEAEYGYDDEYYDYESDDLYYDNEMDEIVVRHYYYYNYPYWFGYPYWYYYPRWRPYPYWYESGFYIYPGGSVVVTGLPTFYFTNWYFHYPRHHYYWPHLSTQFVDHYYGHRSVGSSISVSVNNWQSRNRAVVTEKWMERDGQLTERFREYGKFEMERTKYNEQNPKRTMTQKEYLDRHAKRFPAMKKEVDRSRTEPAVRTAPDVKERKTKPDVRTAPDVKERKTEPAVRDRKTVPPRTEPRTEKPRTEVAPPQRKESDKKVIPRRKETTPEKQIPKADKGREYHKNTWERSKNTKQPSRTTPKVRTKSNTPKVTKPKTKTSRVKRKN